MNVRQTTAWHATGKPSGRFKRLNGVDIVDVTLIVKLANENAWRGCNCIQVVEPRGCVRPAGMLFCEPRFLTRPGRRQSSPLCAETLK